MSKFEEMRHLLDELRTARPLLLYGDPWIRDIERVLALPDDPPIVAASCAECGKTSTRDSMWALYCVSCIETKIGPALLGN
jgi:hypothetical protein